ncbi:MAG TPA: hypothetical protein VNV16_05755 [Methylibium sp.]|nr:hypothetical protein [Methylibium sp.]
MNAPTFEQRDGGDVIDTRLHRAAPIHQPPLHDDAHQWRSDEARAREIEHEELMRWTRVDSVLALVVVAVAVVASAYFPGVWFAGWLK